MSIITDYESGLSVMQIFQKQCRDRRPGQEILSPATIWRKLNAMGVSMRPAGPRRGILKNPDRASRIVELRRQGKTYREIVQTVGCCRSYVSRRLLIEGMTQGAAK